MSSREFNQDIGKAKRAAKLEPVFVTDRGKPTHVLMSFDAFRQVTGRTESIVDLLAMPETDAVAFDATRGGSWDRREEGF